ncbi:PREDICTED: vicilin-like seed storage protein At2g18540 [Camelina sativa]|uniref:Vicilin-like seed storage protein At2g18540 n=1 Tax=Camelina sativa TaxID=90675 RepID=A0ABM0SRA5_CAMSA|nr:PREDICTED: vicilin-like seed storage protein At2g18540 [Camelina sativa]
MESLGGIGFSNTSSATKKKRSTTLRRPWNERQLQDASSLPSTPIPDNNENKIEEIEAVESDEGSTNGSFQGSNLVRQGGAHSTASTEGFLVPCKRNHSINTTEHRAGFDENTIKKVKLKLGGSSKTINVVSASDGASDIGLCSTKSSHAPDDALAISQTNQEISNERSAKLRETPLDTASKSDSCNDTQDRKTKTNPIRKSNRISKRRVLDEELDSLDDDDEEIQFLKRMKMARVVAAEEDVDDDEERSRKHKKLSKVMKQNVELPRGVGTSEKSGKKDRTGKAFDDADYVKDDDDEEEEVVSDVEPGNKSSRTRRAAEEGQSEVKTEMTVTTRRRSGHSGNLIEFPCGLPPAPPRKRKENGLEVDQQLKKAEAARRRKMQVEKAARESEAEAIRKILGQDSSRKKKEDKIKKRQEEKAKEKAADTIARRSDTVKWVMGPSGTIVTFPEELGLPTIFNSTPHSYPPPRERCAGPECTNPYKYRDSESNLPLCSLRCYKAIKG